ncbi:TetR/AcrR family transcriptional regulator [Nocardia ignorata]|uniref:TetR/AcrR family transcriptional regulator n=1 Tax=Nocardia ignorata TaxID=145285 RepID=UPI000A9A29EB|nr:helix-turn-helix domain-containing protein [Nocardia ignorata]
MARPRLFTDDQVLDAARDLLADPAVARPSIAAIGKAASVHSGSIYVRFASRDELLARLWLRSIRRFHEGFVSSPRCAGRSRCCRRPSSCLATAVSTPPRPGR